MPDLKRNVQRGVRCPQKGCRSSMVELTEIGVHIVLRFSRQPDNTMKRVHIEKRMLDSYVEGRCEVCDNTWKLRGVEHLSELQYHFPAARSGQPNRRVRAARPVSTTGAPARPATVQVKADHNQSNSPESESVATKPDQEHPARTSTPADS